MKAFIKLAIFVALFWSGAEATAAGRFFCCNDTSGKQTCGDILPQSCYGRAYRELGENGQTVRHVAAPLTPEQREQLASEEAQRRVQDEQRREQQRQDMALLATYSTENDIELMRESALADIKRAIRNAEGRIEEVRIRRKKFEDEAEFYKKKENIPAKIQKGLTDTENEIKAQDEIIATRKSEVAIIQAKYDQDLQRYRDIKKKQSQPTQAAQPTPPGLPAQSAPPR